MPTPGATTAAPTAPLVLQIGNAGALAQVRVNSTNNVLVMTSQPGIPAIVRVAYSDGTVQTLGPQTTDGNGNATLTWRAHPKTGLGKLRGLLANLVASATDANGQTISSAPITTIILL